MNDDAVYIARAFHGDFALENVENDGFGVALIGIAIPAGPMHFMVHAITGLNMEMHVRLRGQDRLALPGAMNVDGVAAASAASQALSAA